MDKVFTLRNGIKVNIDTNQCLYGTIISLPEKFKSHEYMIGSGICFMRGDKGAPIGGAHGEEFDVIDWPDGEALKKKTTMESKRRRDSKYKRIFIRK
jgi:hypothetical protein